VASRSSGSRGATRRPPSPRAVSVHGYGDSDALADPTAYSIFHIVGDMVALLDHLGLPKVLYFPSRQTEWWCLFLPSPPPHRE
jgi:pimeloyl-ACP methyl ester carboxylesterase